MASYAQSSPYYLAEIVNNEYLDIMIDRPIPKLASDVYWKITTAYEYRPDMLAFDLYANPKLWWVFAQRNPNTLKDPYFDFVTGAGIYLPKLTTLQQVLGV